MIDKYNVELTLPFVSPEGKKLKVSYDFSSEEAAKRFIHVMNSTIQEVLDKLIALEIKSRAEERICDKIVLYGETTRESVKECLKKSVCCKSPKELVQFLLSYFLKDMRVPEDILKDAGFLEDFLTYVGKKNAKGYSVNNIQKCINSILWQLHENKMAREKRERPGNFRAFDISKTPMMK